MKPMKQRGRVEFQIQEHVATMGWLGGGIPRCIGHLCWLSPKNGFQVVVTPALRYWFDFYPTARLFCSLVAYFYLAFAAFFPLPACCIPRVKSRKCGMFWFCGRVSKSTMGCISQLHPYFSHELLYKGSYP